MAYSRRIGEGRLAGEKDSKAYDEIAGLARSVMTVLEGLEQGMSDERRV